MTELGNTLNLNALTVALALAAAGCLASTDEMEALDESAASQEQALAPSALTVMSLNVRIPEDGGDRAWSARLPRLASMIMRYGGGRGPHMIGVQELRGNTRDQLWAELNARGTNYWWYSVDRGDGEMIAVFVRADRLAVMDYNFRGVSNGQRDDDCGLSDDEDPKNRPIQYVKVQDRETGAQSYFYNTHYPSKNSCERHGMSRIFKSYLDTRSDKAARVLLVGDYNDGFESNWRHNGSYDTLLNLTGYVGAYELKHRNNSGAVFLTGNSWNKTARVGKMIDHVLSSNGSLVQQADVDRTMFTASGAAVSCAVVTNGFCSNGMRANDLSLYSDHWAVWATIAP